MKIFFRLMLILMFPCFTCISVPDHTDALLNTPILPCDAARAFKLARPGDTIIIKNGTYPAVFLDFFCQGASEAPITLRAETSGLVIFTGQGQIIISGRYLVVSGFAFKQTQFGEPIVLFRAAYACRFTESSFISCGNAASTKTAIVALDFGSRYNRADHLAFTDNLSVGIAVIVDPATWAEGNTDNLIDFNLFQDITKRGENGQEAVQVGQNQADYGEYQTRTLVESNVFARANGNAEVVSNKAAGNIYRYNTFSQCEGALVLRGGVNCRVESNYFYGGSAGVRVYGSKHIVVNNYIEDCEYGILIDAAHYRKGEYQSKTLSGSDEAAANCLFAFNTAVNSGAYSLYIGRGYREKEMGIEKSILPVNNTFANNLFYEPGRENILVELETVNIFRSNLLWPREFYIQILEGLDFQDPKIQKQGSLYRISSPRSPLINSGSAIPSVTTDFDGQARDTQPDIGCDEYSPTGPNREPLTKQDVGPTWLTEAGKR